MRFQKTVVQELWFSAT